MSSAVRFYHLVLVATNSDGDSLSCSGGLWGLSIECMPTETIYIEVTHDITHAHIHIYAYTYVYVYMCICVL